jgi:predicted nucleic acid-binding protein
MRKVVLDANIFLKVFKEEHDSDHAKVLLKNLAKSITQILAPPVVVNETVHACEREGLDVEAACHLFKGLMALNLSFVPLTDSLIDKTLAITKEGHEKSGFPTFSDSMYHAIAIEEDAFFITADKRHYEKTKHLGNIELLRNIS